MNLSFQLPPDAARTDRAARQMLIQGRWVAAAEGLTRPVHNPSTGSVLAEVPVAAREDIERVARATAVAVSGPWQRMSSGDRGRLLWRIGQLVLDHADELAEIEALNSGRPVTLARSIDVPFAARFFELMSSWCTMQRIADAGAGCTAGAQTLAIIPAPSLPLVSAASRIASALAAGNTATVCVTHDAPLSTLRLCEVLHEAGLPDGVLNVITCSDVATLEHLLEHRAIDRIDYSGSREQALRVAARAAANLKPASIDSSGLRPEVICADADLDLACSAVADAALLAPDQGDDSETVLLVEEPVADEIAERIGATLRGMRPGSALASATRIGPLATLRNQSRHASWLSAARSANADITLSAATDAGGFFARTALVRLADAGGIDGFDLAPNRVITLRTFTRDSLAGLLDGATGLVDLGLWTSNHDFATRLADSVRPELVRLNYVPGDRFEDLCDFYSAYRYTERHLVAAAGAATRVCAKREGQVTDW